MINRYKKEIEILVRAIIQDKEKISVCRKIGKKYYFFPGGHVEFGENAKKALTRELKEELAINIKEPSFIGGSEYCFIKNGIKHHEINLSFRVLPQKLDTKSKEDHLRFFLFDKKQLIKEAVLPRPLKEAILKWLKDKRSFWVSEIDKDFLKNK